MQISLITLVMVVYIILIARMIYKIVIDYDNSNPIKTVAWILVVVFFPVIGLIAYLVLGRNLTKKRSYFKRLSAEVRRHGYFEYGFDLKQDSDNELVSQYTKLTKLLKGLYPLPIFTCNNVELYANGKDKFRRLFPDIERARHHIHILYYTIGDDKIGKAFKNLLIRKRKEGVEVRLIYDSMGCNQTPKRYFKELEEAGVEVISFSPFTFPRFLRTVNYRNHKKIVVIDGEIAYTGGINIKDEYIDGLKWGIWKDVHVRIQGSAAQGLQTVFFIDWYYVCNKYLFLEQYYPKLETFGSNAIQIVTAEPIDQFKNIMQGMIEAIMIAKESVYIETPYFVPSDSMLLALQSAAFSGVDVRIVMPHRSDNKKVQLAANSYVKQLLISNIYVYQYLPGFIHSKLMVIDDEVTIAGSSNLDIRSFELNFETNVFIYDKATALSAKEIIKEDILHSKLVTLEQWEKRKPGERFIESVFRLFSPLL